MAELKTFPKAGDTPETYMKAADERMSEIKRLGAKTEKRWFGIGKKKKLSSADKDYRKLMEQQNLSFHNKAMSLKRKSAKGKAISK